MTHATETGTRISGVSFMAPISGAHVMAVTLNSASDYRANGLLSDYIISGVMGHRAIELTD